MEPTREADPEGSRAELPEVAQAYAEPDAETRATVREPKLFGQNAQVVETWYWALPSDDLRPGEVKPLNLCGRELALWRGRDGKVHCVDAHCPHMGAHFAEGRVQGNELQCFFHGWKFDGEGQLTTIPCQPRTPDVCIKTWPVCERYGLIWVYTGDTPSHGVFEVPELRGQPVDWSHGSSFEKGCHPNIVMVNAIDEQHFTTVHHLPVDLSFKITEDDEQRISFDNQTRVPDTSLFTRLLGRFYRGPLTYKMHYQAGTTGSVTVGPDLLHFHIIFALRPTADGKAQGQTITVTNRRKTIFGWLLNRVLLFATKLVGDYFAHGDTKIFQTIRWGFQQPIAADRSIIRFIKHLEKMSTVPWGTWNATGPRRPAANRLAPAAAHDDEVPVPLRSRTASPEVTDAAEPAAARERRSDDAGERDGGERERAGELTGDPAWAR